MVLRLFIVVMIMPIVTMTTRMEKLLNSLIKSGLSYELAFALTTSINLLSILQADAEEVMEAQKVRGFRGFEGSIIEKIRAYIPLIVPVIMEGFVIARQMEIAMKSRAFGAKDSRTFLIEVRMNKLDWISLFVIVVWTILFTILFLGAINI